MQSSIEHLYYAIHEMGTYPVGLFGKFDSTGRLSFNGGVISDACVIEVFTSKTESYILKPAMYRVVNGKHIVVRDYSILRDCIEEYWDKDAHAQTHSEPVPVFTPYLEQILCNL